jgi:hypothetical protein
MSKYIYQYIYHRGIQEWHINGNGWCDIGYSFLVGGDGNVYEGRGWDEIGAHTGGFNSVVSNSIFNRDDADRAT